MAAKLQNLAEISKCFLAKVAGISKCFLAKVAGISIFVTFACQNK